MESCQCEQGPDDAPTKACELCCKEPGNKDAKCMSSFELNLPPFDVPDMFSKPGTPCNNYAGYCDVFQKCREVSWDPVNKTTYLPAGMLVIEISGEISNFTLILTAELTS